MIRGIVNARGEATLTVRLRGPTAIELDLSAIVDSGFTSALTLPIQTVVALGLTRASSGRATLADGSVRPFDIYAGEIHWGRWQPVRVSAVGRDPLVGMRLLAGHQLRVEVIPGGRVEITPLP